MEMIKKHQQQFFFLMKVNS